MLAVVIPYYKFAFFRETLESLAIQTDRRFHVYIGNDASPEDPEELLKEFEGRFNFTYKRFEKNLGSISLTKQWERCIEMIKDEEWLMVLGDDDRLSGNVVEEFYKSLTVFRTSSNVVRFASQVIDEKGDPVAGRYTQPEYENAIHSYYRKFIGENRGSLSEFIFRRSQYYKFKFKNYPLGWTADDRAVIDFSGGQMIYSINEATVFFRKSSLHISSRTDDQEQKNQAHLRSMFELIRDYQNRMTLRQRYFFIQLFENHVLSFNKVGIKYFVYLFYLYFRYMDTKNIIILFKSIIAKQFV